MFRNSLLHFPNVAPRAHYRTHPTRNNSKPNGGKGTKNENRVYVIVKEEKKKINNVPASYLGILRQDPPSINQKGWGVAKPHCTCRTGGSLCRWVSALVISYSAPGFAAKPTLSFSSTPKSDSAPCVLGTLNRYLKKGKPSL